MTVEIRTFGDHPVERPKRELGPAIRNGALGRCPHCGEGRLFRAFLKPVDTCAVCGEEIHHHRADDLPAYLVILIVGHIVVALFGAAEATTDLSTTVHFLIWIPLTLLLTLVLIQPVKGGVIGLQWALFMHGFGGGDEPLDSHPEA